MAYKQKEGQGSLFKNDKEGNESRPDYKGSITINGVAMWLDAWIKEGKDGKGKWMSLNAKPKEQRGSSGGQAKPARTTAKPAVDDDFEDSQIPFISRHSIW